MNNQQIKSIWSALLLSFSWIVYQGCTLSSDLGDIIQEGDTIIINDDDDNTTFDSGTIPDNNMDAGIDEFPTDDEPSENKEEQIVPPISPERIAQRQAVDLAQERLAVCADGTSGEYFVRPGRGDDIDNMMIFLPGSILCRNLEDCQVKYAARPDRMTIRAEDSPYNIEAGLFSMDETINPFANWTVVFLTPCTMDRFLGRRVGDRDDDTFFHTGDYYLKAVIEDLANEELNPDYNLNSTGVKMIIGSGYAAQAVMNNIDFVETKFPDIDWRFVVDNGFYPSADSTYFSDEWFDEQMGWYDYWDTSLSPSCTRQTPLLNHSSCLFAPQIYAGHTDRRIFQLVQYDSRDLLANAAVTETDRDILAADFRDIFDDFECGMASYWTSGIRLNSNSGSLTQTINDQTLAQTLINWLDDEAPREDCHVPEDL